MKIKIVGLVIIAGLAVGLILLSSCFGGNTREQAEFLVGDLAIYLSTKS